MNRTKSFALSAALAASAAFACNVFGGSPPPAASMPSKFPVDVQCLNCAPPQSSRQNAAPDKNGNFNVDVPVAGQYKVSYADGPKKGQSIATITASAAGPATVTMPASSPTEPAKPTKPSKPKRSGK